MKRSNSLSYFRDIVWIALNKVRRRPIISALTALGITIGIGAMVGMLSLTSQVERALASQIDLLGPNMILILPFNPISAESAETLNVNLDLIRTIDGVNDAGLIFHYRDGLPLNQDQGPAGFPLVIGLSSNTFTEAHRFFSSFEVQSGRIPTRDRNEALLSQGAAQLFSLNAGDRFRLAGTDFTTTGILAMIDDPSLNNAIFIDIQLLWTLAEEQNIASTAWVEASPETDLFQLESNLNVYFAQQGGPYSIQTSERLRQGTTTILSVIKTAMLSVGILALLIGSLGVANTMIMAVTERTREIGIYLSLGATKLQILLIFLSEAALLGFVGGIAGNIFGFGISASLVFLFVHIFGPLQFQIDWALACVAILFSMIISVLAGGMPALRAASIQPVDALRYE